MHPHYGFVGSTYVGNNVGIKQVQQIYGNSIHHQQVPFYSQHSNYSSIHSHQQRNQHYPYPQQQQQAQQQQQQQLTNVDRKFRTLIIGKGKRRPFFLFVKERKKIDFFLVLNNTFTLCTDERKTSLFASFIHFEKK
jgi:hypothetical protein